MGCRHTKLDEREYDDEQNNIYSDLIGKKVRLLFKYHDCDDSNTIRDKYELGYYTLQVLNEDSSDYVESVTLTNTQYNHMELIVDGEPYDVDRYRKNPFTLQGKLEFIKIYSEMRYVKGLCYGKWRWRYYNMKVEIDGQTCECIGIDKPFRHSERRVLTTEMIVDKTDDYASY